MAQKAWSLLPDTILLFAVIITIGWSASGASAEGFILTEGQFRSHPPIGQVDDSIFCSYPAQALNILFMTPSPGASGQNPQNSNLSTRCLHARPVQLLGSDNTVLSFSTTFKFVMAPNNSSSGEAIDGLAFVMTADLIPPSNSQGGFLGLLNATTNNKNSSHLLAVEFDSFSNREFRDFPSDHVGIDLNSLVSTNSSPAGYYQGGCTGDDPFNPMELANGSPMQAWITYDAPTQLLSVILSSVPGFKPQIPLLETKVDLSSIIQENMYVGFSSSTGNVGGYSYVFAWSFNVGGPENPITPEKLLPTAICPTITKKPKLWLILGIAVPTTAVALLLIAGLGLFYLRRVKQNLLKQFHDLIELENLDYRPRKYMYKELSTATGEFSPSQVLGKGGYGSVYKGILPDNGAQNGPLIVAVKRVFWDKSQTLQESMAEVEIIGRLHHRNLVQLLGWCREKDELLLVYEYMVNGSLDQWLFNGRRSSNKKSGDTEGEGLPWSKRLHILCGVATALGYLHDEWKQVVVHRDVKASNVLLDGEFNGKLGDFGLARLHEHKQQEFQSTKVAGTLGYLAPEARGRGKFTNKSDVFSFGALSLEVACGRRPVDVKKPNEEIVLVSWVWELYECGRILDAIDENLIRNGVDMLDQKTKMEMAAVLQVGILCSNPDPDLRPTMRQVVQMLKGEIPLLPIPTLPRRSKSRVPSFSYTLGDHYIWADHSVELGMIENSEELKLIPPGQHSTSYSKEPSFSFVV